MESEEKLLSNRLSDMKGQTNQNSAGFDTFSTSSNNEIKDIQMALESLKDDFALRSSQDSGGPEFLKDDVVGMSPTKDQQLMFADDDEDDGFDDGASFDLSDDETRKK